MYACVYTGSLPKCKDVGVLIQMLKLAQAKAASKEKGSDIAKSCVKPAAQEPRQNLAGNLTSVVEASIRCRMEDLQTHTQRGQTNEEQGQKDQDKDEDYDEFMPPGFVEL